MDPTTRAAFRLAVAGCLLFLAAIAVAAAAPHIGPRPTLQIDVGATTATDTLPRSLP